VGASIRTPGVTVFPVFWNLRIKSTKKDFGIDIIEVMESLDSELPNVVEL
jgi:hypothetical protein